jgi:hypothetical protein
VTITPSGRRPPGFLRVVLARSADADLRLLLADVVDRRRAMQAELRLPVNTQRRIIVQRHLLAALESYTSALSTRGLVVPPKLRDELALQRGLADRR